MTQYNTFQYHYYLESYLLTDTTGNSESVTYDSQDCTYCLNNIDSANNAKMTAYAAGIANKSVIITVPTETIVLVKIYLPNLYDLNITK